MLQNLLLKVKKTHARISHIHKQPKVQSWKNGKYGNTEEMELGRTLHVNGMTLLRLLLRLFRSA